MRRFKAPLSIFGTGPVGLNYCAECADTETPHSALNIPGMLSVSIVFHGYLLMHSLHYLQNLNPDPMTSFIYNLK